MLVVTWVIIAVYVIKNYRKMSQLDKSMSALTKFLQSEEGKESIRKYWQEKEEQAKLYAFQVERFYQKHKANMPTIIEKIIAKYESSEYVRREYKLGYEPRESLYWLLESIASKYGTEVEINNENVKKYPQLNMFTGSAFIFEGYLFQILHGQGSAVRIDKI
jgi:hypothetical protein